MSDDGPIRAYIGNYDLSTTDLLIPAEVLARANAEIEAERERRRGVAEAEQAAAEEAARAKGWRGRLRAFFGRKGP